MLYWERRKKGRAAANDCQRFANQPYRASARLLDQADISALFGRCAREKRKGMGKKPVFRFAVLLLAALGLQLVPLLFQWIEGDGGLALYMIHLYVIIPLAAAVLPFWAGLGGVHPLAAFFPVGGALLLPVYHSPETGLVCLLISLVASVAAQEYIRRRDGAKGGHHGRNTRKKTKK